MGAIVPTISQGVGFANSVLGTVNAVDNLINLGSGNTSQQRNMEREQRQALSQLQARQRLQEQQLAAQTALERERITAQAQIDEAQRRDALKRAVARQRARFGSSGIGNAGNGSAQAVLLGLFDETEEELAQRERLDGLRHSALDLDVASQQSLNVLQRTQLQEKQRFERELLGDSFLF